VNGKDDGGGLPKPGRGGWVWWGNGETTIGTRQMLERTTTNFNSNKMGSTKGDGESAGRLQCRDERGCRADEGSGKKTMELTKNARQDCCALIGS